MPFWLTPSATGGLLLFGSLQVCVLRWGWDPVKMRNCWFLLSSFQKGAPGLIEHLKKTPRLIFLPQVDDCRGGLEQPLSGEIGLVPFPVSHCLNIVAWQFFSKDTPPSYLFCLWAKLAVLLSNVNTKRGGRSLLFAGVPCKFRERRKSQRPNSICGPEERGTLFCP